MADTPGFEKLDSGFEENVSENPSSDQSAIQNRTSSISPDDLKCIIAKVEQDDGKFIKDKDGRYLIVYPDDKSLLNDYNLSIPHEEISVDSESGAFRSRVGLCIQGIIEQKVKKYPFTVIQNPKNKRLLHTSERGEYRQNKEYSIVETLYKNPFGFTRVEIVKDFMSGFKHICKSIIISKFRPEEVDAMGVMAHIAPDVYGICRDGEDVKLHMEYIQGTSLDCFSKILIEDHIWPVCLHLFAELTRAINKLGVERLSHGDIHLKNVIIEVERNNTFRIRLIDYGEASSCTLAGLMNDMQSLVACIITVFTENQFNSYKEDPINWISQCKIRYPQLCAILEGALMVQNTNDLRKLIEDLDLIIKTEIGYKHYLTEAAKTVKETTKPKNIELDEDLRNLHF